MTRRTPYVAALRIYEPLSAFEPADRLVWEEAFPIYSTVEDEQTRAMQRLIAPTFFASVADGAHILDYEDVRYVSPWSTATRSWAAYDNFTDSMPSTVTKYFFTPAIEELITSGADYIDNKVPHILTETWLIPPRWFSLFAPEERMRGSDSNGAFCIARAKIANAKARCKFTHEAVVNAFGEGGVEEEIQDLYDWMDMFHPKSLVELDYGGLADYLNMALAELGGIEADSSIEDIHESLAGLAANDGATAGLGYERLIARSRKVSAIEQAS